MNDEATRWRMMAEQMAEAAHRLILAAEDNDTVELANAAEAAKYPHKEISDEATDRMARLLPAWLTERMLNDVWEFGLLLTTGQLLHIETIHNVCQAADGSLWLDVRLGKKSLAHADYAAAGWPPMLHAVCDRDTCSVAVAQIVCAVELADT